MVGVGVGVVIMKVGVRGRHEKQQRKTKKRREIRATKEECLEHETNTATASASISSTSKRIRALLDTPRETYFSISHEMPFRYATSLSLFHAHAMALLLFLVPPHTLATTTGARVLTTKRTSHRGVAFTGNLT